MRRRVSRCAAFRDNLMVSSSRAKMHLPCTFRPLQVRTIDYLETSGINYPAVRRTSRKNGDSTLNLRNVLWFTDFNNVNYILFCSL
jgi:hypothetical protein